MNYYEFIELINLFEFILKIISKELSTQGILIRKIVKIHNQYIIL